MIVTDTSAFAESTAEKVAEDDGGRNRRCSGDSGGGGGGEDVECNGNSGMQMWRLDRNGCLELER